MMNIIILTIGFMALSVFVPWGIGRLICGKPTYGSDNVMFWGVGTATLIALALIGCACFALALEVIK